MKITVRKPTTEETSFMHSQPIWTCGVSEFDWFYDNEENCLLLEGKVTVTYDGGEVAFSVGDYVVFPQGLNCVWHVSEPVKKHYVFK
jgi:uncharacterized cupin superfamily protein